MNYIDPAIAALFRSPIAMGIYFRLGVVPPLCLWCGVNDAPQQMQSVDDGAVTYIGAGKLTGLPEFDVLISGQAARYEFTLEGVSPDSVALIERTKPTVMGKAFHIGIAPLDAAWQPLTPILPLVEGQADYWAVTQERARGDETASRNLSLSVGFGDTNRSRPRRVTYTHAQQQVYAQGDDACRNVARYNAGYVATWPRFK